MTIPEKETMCCNQSCNNCLHNQPLDILFQQQVSRTPGKPAVIFKNQQVSYKELDEKSDAIARKLISVDNSATSDGRIVALLMEPCVEMIVAILGILKSGAAYMPVDVDFPDERVNYLLAESKAETVITQQHLSERLGNYNGTVMQIDDSNAFTGNSEDRLPVQKTDGQSLACILYTSGSTGKPKGVMIEHRSIARLAINNNFFVLRADDKVLNVQNYCFDATLYNFFSCLLNGATLVLLPKKDFIDLKKLAAYIKKEKPTVIQFTTSFFNLVVDQQINCLAGFRKIFFGGEAASVKHVRTVFEKYGPGKMINVYGPTENTVFSAVHEVSEMPADAKSISIGKAVTGTNCLILDENLQQVKQGETGELYVGGIGLSRGYLNQNSLWQSKLVRNPFQPNENLYRTGDLVRIDAQCQLQFVGRKDNQVKINGYRIELEEVAHVLMEYENILMAKVFVDENPNGKSLKAFTVAREKLDLEDLKTFLRQKLPPYMIPASFYETDTAPLNTNGKLDISSVIGNSLKSEMVTGELNGGKGMLQRKLLRLWRNALSNDSIGPDDNFFDQGGNSMKAIQLVADIEKETGASDRLEKLYRYPTVNLFLENISRKSTLHTRYFVPLNNFVPGNDNFFVMPASWGEENDFNEVAVKLDNHANYFKIQLAGLFENKMEKSIPALAGNIIRRIKKIPRGEMTFIIGYSWAAFLAFEVVRQLEPATDTCLLLFDCDPHFTIDTSEISLERYDWFTLETVAQYVNHIKTSEDLLRLKKFWMNNNFIHAAYKPAATLKSDIYAFEALDHLQRAGKYENKEGLGNHANMQLWNSYTTGSFTNHLLEGSHSTIVKQNTSFLRLQFLDLIQTYNYSEKHA